MTPKNRTPNNILGLFDQLNAAADALAKLKGIGGHTDQSLMVLSSVPFPEGVLETEHPKSWMPVITVVSALVGIGLGLLLAGGTAALYVLRTGGKPIESGPPMGIIAYETMMLIALSAAFATALFEMRLPNWRTKVYDPRIAEGYIGIAVKCDSETAYEATESLLREAGAVDVRRDARAME